MNPKPPPDNNENPDDALEFQQMETAMENDKIEEANRELQEYHGSEQYEKDEEQFLTSYDQSGGK